MADGDESSSPSVAPPEAEVPGGESPPVADGAEAGDATMTSIEGDAVGAPNEEGTNTEPQHEEDGNAIADAAEGGGEANAEVSAVVAEGVQEEDGEQAAAVAAHATEGEAEAPAAEGEPDAPAPEGEADAAAPEGEAEAAAAEGEAEAAAAEGEAEAVAAEGEAEAAAAEGEAEAATGEPGAPGSDAAAVDSSVPAANDDAAAPGSAAGSRAGSRPASARPGSGAAGAASDAGAGSRPTSRQGDNLPGDEMQALGSQAGSTSGSGSGTPARDATPPPRVESSTASRPPSGRPGSARPTSARPSSGARPASGARTPSPLAPTAEAPSEPATDATDAAVIPAAAAAAAPEPPAAAAAAAPLPGELTAPKVSDYNHADLRSIDVEVNQGEGLPYKMVSVLLDSSQMAPKPYLGGYKNKRTGVVYHHAVTQTPKPPKYTNAEPKLERTTQTVKTKPISGQTVREAATQMERPGVVVDTAGDRVVTPGRYQTSEERLAIVTGATCVLQRFWRGCLGRRRAAYLRAKRDEREAFLREEEAKAAAAAEAHRAKEIERRMHPRTAADFEILYNELEAWRLQETSKIKAAGLARDKELEVLQQLLHKETKLLQTIDRLKINANYENKDLRVQRTLAEMGKAKTFDLKNGGTVDVHTPFTTRAMELMQLYNGLNLAELTIDERLDVLLHVKWTVKEFDCALTREVVELIDREADMLNRGRAPRMLEGLRKRISSLFLTFIETPEFNPEATRFQIVPMDFESYLFNKIGTATARSQMTTTADSKWDR